MPLLPYSIELHDSLLSEIERIEQDCVVRLRPAYIHQDGKGWNQDIDLVFLDAQISQQRPSLPARIADGSMRTRSGQYHNLLAMPLTELGSLIFTLEFFDESTMEIKAEGVHAVIEGPLTFVEVLE